MAAFSSRKYAACVLFTLMAAISQPSNVNAGYTMKETCAYLSKGYIADPSNCAGWGYCSGGSLLKQGICDNGLLYDSANGMCNYKHLVTCASTMQNACENQVDPGYIADPNNCNAYGYCANGKIQQQWTCPQFQVYNPNTETCVWGKDYTCPANSICRLIKNNEFAGDPVTCGNYIRCQNGAGVSQKCTTGLFNPIKGGCDPNYSCSTTPGEPGTPNTPNVPQQNATVCDQYDETKGKVQYFTDWSTCNGYYACSAKDAVGIWGTCPWATHFNGEKCVTPYTYACPYDRCANLNLAFVAEIGCKNYAVCNNQVTVATGNCAASNANYPFYDEYGGGCVVKEPNEHICKATEADDPTGPTPAPAPAPAPGTK